MRARRAGVLWLTCATLAHAKVHAPNTPVLRFDIPRQTLTAALANFAEQTSLQYVSEVLDGQYSRPASAGAPPARALSQMLRCTGLKAEFLNARSVRITTGGKNPDDDPECDSEDQVTVRGKLHGDHDLKPAVNVVPWSGTEMQALGIEGLADVAALTPLVEFDFLSSVGSAVYNNLDIRGISDRHGSPTTAFVDDVPVPHIRANNVGRALPSAFDLKAVDFPRGPQSAVLGADTQGGAVRFFTTEPDLEQRDANLVADWRGTDGAADTYALGASVGGPLIADHLAYRISGWNREEGGFVDRVDPFTREVVDADADSATSRSLRGALRYKSSQGLTITLSLDYELNKTRDSRSFMTYLSDPDSARLYNGSLIPQPASDKYLLHYVKVDYPFELLDIHTTTAFFERNGHVVIDDTQSGKWGGWGNELGPAYPASYGDVVTTTLDVHQRMAFHELELRGNTSDDGFSWLGGFVWTREDYTEDDHVTATHIPALGDLPLDASDVTTIGQTRFALYGQLSRRLAKRFTLTAGLRVEHSGHDANSVAPPALHAQESETLNAPKFVLDYQDGSHGHYYLLAAKGYSPAGVDPALPTCFSGPRPYPTDTLWSFELGTRQRVLLRDHIYFDAALFHANWTNGPELWSNCLLNHVPGPAESRGLELNLNFVWPQTRAMLMVGYTDAHYTRTLTQGSQVVVSDGDALGTPPQVMPPWMLTALIEQHFTFDAADHLTLRLEDIYRTRNPGPFYTQDPASIVFAPGLTSDPTTNLLNLRGTLEREKFGLSLYLDNALDSQPTLLRRNKGTDINSLYFASTFRPRTLGLSVSTHF